MNGTCKASRIRKAIMTNASISPKSNFVMAHPPRQQLPSSPQQEGDRMPEPRHPGQPCKKMHSGALLIFRRLRPAPRRPAGPLSHLAQLPRDLDPTRRRSARAARVEEHFVLRGPDFGLDDLDG